MPERWRTDAAPCALGSVGKDRHMVTAKLQPIGPALQRRVRRAMRKGILFAAILGAIVCARVLDRRDRRAATEQARMCALAIQAGAENPSATIRRMRNQFDGLLGVAMIDSANRHRVMVPEDTTARKAFADSLSTVRGGPVATAIGDRGDRQAAWGVVVTFDRRDAASTDKIVILLKRSSDWHGWVTASIIFALLALVVVWLAARSVGRWFSQRVGEPLRRLASPWDPAADLDQWVAQIAGREWRETTMIADNLREIALDALESRSCVERAVSESVREFGEREKGFNRALRRAQDAATIDPLTGLRNRRFLDAEFAGLIQAKRARGENLAIVMVDIDNFKHLNDTKGHAAGDELLRFIGQLLRSATRREDVAVRYGGDEFVLLMSGLSAAQAAPLVERIGKLFGQYAATRCGDKPVTLSAGVTSIKEQPDADAQTLLRRADGALYAAKRNGKNAIATA